MSQTCVFRAGCKALLIPIVLTVSFVFEAAAQSAPAPIQNPVTEFLDKSPVLFIENRANGGADDGFYVEAGEKKLIFRRDGVEMNLAERNRIKLEFIGCNPATRIIGRDPAATIVSCFRGGPEHWRAGLHTFSSIVYEDLWPGIDLIYRGSRDQIKYEFVVRPGADPSLIRMRYIGASAVAVNAAGQLEIAAGAATLRDDAPIAYSRGDSGYKVPVASAYAVNGNVIGFSLGNYDRNRALVIDPAVLVYCGYTGPIMEIRDIAVGPDGSVYLIGSVTVTSTNRDVYIAKVNWSGKSLDFITSIGGTGSDYGRGIAVDAVGNIYITGITTSFPSSFPLTVGPDLTFNGTYDVFVAKLNPTGTGILYCGYIGGGGSDQPRDIAVDSNGGAYVFGETSSSEATFPVKIGPVLKYKGGVQDTFVAKVNSSGSSLDYCGYIGGSAQDDPYAIIVDQSGCAYVAGDTLSTDFPVAVGPDLTCNGGNTDAFIAKISASGDRFVYSSYLGGNMADIVASLDVDAAGHLYFAGITWSAQDTFPVKGGPDLTFNGGYSDGFVGRLNAAGTAVEWCGYIGGDSFDGASHIHPGAGGLVYIAGSTQTSEATFPVKTGPDLTFNGNADAFVACLRESTLKLDWCGYVGGTGTDGALGAGSGSSLYIGGMTDSTEATFPVKIGPKLTYQVDGTLKNGYVAKISGAGFTSLQSRWSWYR